MNISNATKELIRSYKNEINNNQFDDLFVDAHLKRFTPEQIMEIHNILHEAKIFDSRELRNKLLWEEVRASLKIAESHQDDPDMKDKYLIQFIRSYLGSRFGFNVDEVVEFMLNNQEALGIVLEPYNRSGQASVGNYIILFYLIKDYRS